MSAPQRRTLDHHDRDPLDRALDRACGSRAIGGNAVHHLTDGPQAYEAMHDLIAGAQRNINFENYIIRDDATGQAFADLLIAAAARGVPVRLLYDDWGCRRTGRAFWRRLRAGGVVVTAFNKVNPLFPRRAIVRDHRKYVSVDSRRAVVGGLCVGDEWAGDPAKHRLPWRDTAVEIRGPAVPVLDLAFEHAWELASAGRLARTAGSTRTTGATPVAGRLPQRVEPCGQAVVRVIEGGPGRHRVERVIQALAGGVAERLWITDAYLVAPAALFATLLAAARDKVDVCLLLPGNTDLPVVRAFTRAGYRELLEAGARIFEWAGPMLHAKTVLVDNSWFKVGSSNLNASSLTTNYELDVLVTDPQAARAAVAQFRHDLLGAAEIVLRPRRPLLSPHVPPAVVSSGRPERAPHQPARGERSQRAIVALRSVAAGARRSIAGAVVFAAAGAGVFALFAPRVLASLVAFASFTLAGRAMWNFFRRRRDRDE